MNRILAGICTLTLLAATGSSQAPAPAAPAQTAPAQTAPAQPEPTVPGGLNLNNASLLEVINMLAQDLHLSYVLDSSVRGGTVTINTYGAIRDVDLRPLLETILRMNNLAMVQAGNIYRIIPIANIARQPVSPVRETDPSKIPDDERLVLNLVFLRYVSSTEMQKILTPFIGDGAQLTNYEAANLLIVLDNSRNMKRTLELINMFDSDTFAGQRVHSFDVKNGRPSDLTKELDEIFKAYALAGDSGKSPIHFLPIDRINTILAVSPNPATFDEVEKWIQKLDIPSKVTAGSIDNYVYRLRYARAEVVGSVVMQLYGGPPSNLSSGLYGGMPGNSSYPASGYGGAGYGQAGAYPGGGYNGAPGQSGAGGYGAYQNNMYQGGSYPNNMQNTGQYQPTGAGVAPSTGLGTVPSIGANGLAGGLGQDRTGTYLGAPMGGFGGGGYGYGYNGPRIIPNPFDNTLLVQGTPQQWEQIRHLLEQLDIAPRQVLIDAKIYEVDLTGNLSYGVESFLQKSNTTNSLVPGHQALGSSTPTSGLGGGAGLSLTAGMLVGQSRQLLALLQANEFSSKTKVLSSPSIIATDSIPASITVGDSVPTLSSVAASNVQQNGNSLFTNTIQNTSTGIGLNILARVTAGGVVTMVITQNVTAPEPTTSSSIDSPSFSQRNVSTQVTVEDGDTVAIGGIITENTTATTSGIPILDRIPYIGAAFGTKSSTKQRTELIVFLTPRVIYDTTQMTDATDDLKEKVRGLRKMIGKD
ncbi:MAG TPA: type II secretion system secretin GspD [Bryobacteraceae bacterium]|jgi:general secretion pathway protein D|nr:type II secretion system secretin GspD [Bryobacteraceae bacterium]